jgi:hypothetical protein
LTLANKNKVQKYGTANALILQEPSVRTESPDMRYIPPEVTSKAARAGWCSRRRSGAGFAWQVADSAPIRAADRLRSEHIEARLTLTPMRASP